MSIIHKVIKQVKSMKFGIFLLALLGGLSVFGSIIPQGREIPFYHSRFSEMKSNLILSLKLNDIYHSWYFIGLSSLLSINLLLCSILRLDTIIRKIKGVPSIGKETYIENITFRQSDNLENYINNLFDNFGFKKVIKKDKNGDEIYYSKKNSIGYFGSWCIHLGILLTIISYGYGQYTHFSSEVYGVPGSEVEVEGTEFTVSIEDFRIDYREDGTVGQYYTNMKLLNDKNELLNSKEISVNHPLNYKGYNFYQSATGWATNIQFMKDEKEVVEDLLYEGTFFVDEEEGLAIQFTKFFPDFVATEGGLFTRSHETNNPMFLYALFFNGRRVGMNVVAPGDVIEWNEYDIILDNPKMYTYLQVNKVKGKLGAALGSLLVMIGLVLAFYIKPVTMMVKKTGNKLLVYGNGLEVVQSKTFINKQIDVYNEYH